MVAVSLKNFFFFKQKTAYEISWSVTGVQTCALPISEGVLKLVKVSDDIGYPYVSMCDRCYKYFIPKDKVVFEGEEPKQYRYRPFKYIYELPFRVGDSIAIRVKKAPFAIYAVVSEIICNDDKIVFISFGTTLSMFSPNHYFNGYEFSINDEWIPFGVECEEDE